MKQHQVDIKAVKRTGARLGAIVLALVLTASFVSCDIAWNINGNQGRLGSDTLPSDTGTEDADDGTRGWRIIVNPETTDATDADTGEYTDELTDGTDRADLPDEPDSDTGTETGKSEKAAEESRKVEEPTDTATEALTKNEAADTGDDPGIITIRKTSSLRKDNDRDGYADTEYGADGNVLTSAGDSTYTIPTVANLVRDAVVEITTETIKSSAFIGQYVTSGAGSGVIIAPEGFIVTNNHVIEGADSIQVRLRDGTTFDATLIGTDEESDIAVIKIERGKKKLSVATLGCSWDLVVGETILAIGNPLGSLGGTVTEGIISATERLISVQGTNMTLLQISSPINPGNSGGGLFNMAGQLVGIVNAKCSEDDVEGLGFAIPIDKAYNIIIELLDHGYVKGRPTTGLTLVDVTSSQTAYRYFGLRYTGVYVYKDAGDFAYGDLILTFDGTEVSSVSDIEKLVKKHKVGDRVSIEVYRKSGRVTLTLTLTEYVPSNLKGAE